MHSHGDDDSASTEPASLHLTAELRPRERPGGIRGLVHTVAYLAGTALSLGSPSVADIIVVRTSTGNEVLRSSAGDLVEADTLLQQIRRDLDEMTVSEFLGEWGHIS
ncbi:hypothetical protein [Microterricola pindariensis]|uniref:Uncharacterized protein n=1 Tax=Microterricola pindariensis TaxID=478010 RepID=A0ABX5ASW4_9MICO|nr:hypothetical protein [Microterricola pindariensis]PPL15818.1 hypothetical protein GY24_13720 [Microterricola pindariensis]